VKQQLPPNAHDAHDAILIARLFGGDVTDVEREHATSLVAGCSECASLFADLGAIAATTRALPTPPRPRDFTLTEADVARLSRRAGWRGRFVRPGLRTAFGGAMAALGLAGVLLTGAATMLTSTARTESAAFDSNASPANYSGQGAIAMPTAAPTAGPAQLVSGGAVDGAGASSSLPPRLPSIGTAGPSAGPAAESGDNSTGKSAGSLAVTTAPPAPASDASSHAISPPNPNDQGGSSGSGGGGAGSSPDARTIGLVGFGATLLVGLLLLVGPAALRRLRRPSH